MKIIDEKSLTVVNTRKFGKYSISKGIVFSSGPDSSKGVV
jgi:hypothetical protein